MIPNFPIYGYEWECIGTRGVGARRACPRRSSIARSGGSVLCVHIIGPTAARGTGMARPPKQQAQAADQHVGRRIREWRIILGFSQRTLSGQIGVTSQQLRKY